MPEIARQNRNPNNTLIVEQITSGRKRSSRFGKKELKLIRTMFEDAPVGMGLMEGPDHRIQYMNRYLNRLYGNRSWSRGLRVEDFWTSKEREEAQRVRRIEMLNRVYESGEPFIVREQQVGFDRGNGQLEEGYFNFVFQPLVEKNEVFGISLSGYEVTDLVTIREKSVLHENQLKLALEGGFIGYWEVDPHNEEILFVSRRWREQFGKPDRKGWTLEEFYQSIHYQDRQPVKEEIERAMERARRYEVEFRVCWPDGSMHWILARGQSLQKSDAGQPHCLVGVTEEITGKKQAERKLKEAIQLRDNFLSIAAHELQTPVTSLKMRGDLFERQVRDRGDSFETDQVSAINRHIDQLSTLTKKLLDTSRMQVEDLDLEREPVAVDKLVGETADILSHITDHSIRIEGEPVRRVYADRFRIGQVLTNIMENAIKYSPGEECIAVRYRQEPDTVVISVIDYGVGISPDDKERVFERFFKGGGERKSTYPGFGMGLYISEQIIRRHGGGIWVEDHPEGGSVFHVSLPVAD